MKKWLKLLLISLGLVLLLIMAVYFWLTRSQAGARWVLNLAASETTPVLAFENISGSLLQDLKIGKIHYQEPGIEVLVNDLSVKIDAHFLPLKISVQTLTLKEVFINSSQSTTETTEEISDDFTLPLDFEIESARIEHIVYSDGKLRILADNTQLALTAGNNIQINQLRSKISYQTLDASAATESTPGALTINLDLSGNSDLIKPWRHQLQLQLTTEVNPANTDPYIQLLDNNSFKLQANGSTTKSQINLHSSGQLNFELQAELGQLLKNPDWQLKLQSEQLQLPLAPEEQLNIQKLDIHGQGDLKNWQAQGGADLSFTNTDNQPINAHWELAASGNPDAIEISKLGLSGEIGKLDFTGSLDPVRMAINGELDWQQFKFTSFVSDIAPQSSSGSGKIQYAGNTLAISDLEALIDNTDTRLNADINIGDAVSAQINWQNLGWPLGTETADYFSKNGSLNAEGGINDYSLNGQFELAGNTLPTGSYQLLGQGDKGGLVLHNLNSQMLDGDIHLSGNVRWQAPLSAQLNIQATDINPGIKWPDFPGLMAMDLDLSWAQTGAQDADLLDIQLHHLKGQLRDLPLQLGGEIQLKNGQNLNLDIKALSGASSLVLKAETDITQLYSGNADFELDIVDLSNLIPAAEGQIKGSGKLQESADGQQLILKLQGSNIEVTGYSIELFDLQMNSLLPTDNKQPIQLTGLLQAAKIQSSDLSMPIDSIEIEASKAKPGQNSASIKIRTVAEANRLDAELDANFWLQNKQLMLDGELAEVNLTTAVTGPLVMQAPAKIQFSQQAMALEMEPACFRQQPDSLQAEVCLSREKVADRDEYAARLRLENFPLAWVTSYLPIDIIFSQTLTGVVSLTGGRGLTDIRLADGDFSLSPGLIASIDLSEGSLETSQGLLKFSLDPQKQLSGQFDLPFKVGNGLKFNFTIDEPENLEQASINSQLDIDLDDLIALKWLIPGLDDLSGDFVAKMQINGKLSEATVIGDLDIHDVGFIYTPLGLEMSQIELQGEIKSGENSALNGSFLAGDGQGEIQLQVDNTGKNTALSLNLKGENLQLLNAPDLKLKASPDLQLELVGNTLKLAGNIDIPSARISPLPGMLSATTVSADVLVTGLDTAPPEPTKELPLVINGGIKVKLGDDVKFKMDAVKTQLTGGLELIFDGKSATPSARGEIQLIDGYFNQYGQNLEFLNSNIYFDGQAVSNPKLDIYAVRHIFADPEVELAGIHISGRPDNITLKLYTDPETDQESAVAYIATGSNFDHGNGVGTLNIGTYIYPKLFVSYGVGLFDTGNVVSARYELSKRWAVQGTSSDSESGVDILYSIDR